MPDLASRLAGHSSATALLEGDTRITYGELADRVARTASGIREKGLATGARVAVLADPTVDGVVAYLGVQAAGMLPIMLSPRSPLAELQRRYDEISPRAHGVRRRRRPASCPTAPSGAARRFDRHRLRNPRRRTRTVAAGGRRRSRRCALHQRRLRSAPSPSCSPTATSPPRATVWSRRRRRSRSRHGRVRRSADRARVRSQQRRRHRA